MHYPSAFSPWSGLSSLVQQGGQSVKTHNNSTAADANKSSRICSVGKEVDEGDEGNGTLYAPGESPIERLPAETFGELRMLQSTKHKLDAEFMANLKWNKIGVN
jgi:hypothetical protein